MIGNRLPDRIWIPQPTVTTLEWPELVEYRRVDAESNVQWGIAAYAGRQAMRDAVALLTDVMTGHRDPANAYYYNECDKEPCDWCRDTLKTIFALNAATGDTK